MRLRDPRVMGKPELVIVPMIDIMFFLLVFFMMSTMYMTELKTIPVKLPQAAHASVDTKTTFAVSMKQDGSLYLGDAPTDLNSLLLAAKTEKQRSDVAIVIRADAAVDYGKVIALVDDLKGAGISRFAFATEGGR